MKGDSLDGEVFDLFKPLMVPARKKYLMGKARSNSFCGPVRPIAMCEICSGPREKGESACRPCVRTGHLQEFAAVVDYWMKLWLATEPDFAPELIEAIERRENELGRPACRWPAEETATFQGVTQ